MKTQEEMKTEVSDFLENHPQFYGCKEMLYEYAELAHDFAIKDSDSDIVLGIAIRIASLQQRLEFRKKAFRQDEVRLLHGFLDKLTNGNAVPLSKTA